MTPYQGLLANATERPLDILLRGDIFEATFDAAGVGLAIVDLTGHFVRVNPAFARLHDTLVEDLVGQPFKGHERLASLLGDQLPDPLRFEEETRDDIWLSLGVSLRKDPQDRPAWFIVDAVDVTRRRRAEHALQHRALHDDLTGLPNRVLVRDRITTALARGKRSGQSVGIAFLDLDGFKDINDQHGHLLGDVVLRVVATRLQSVVRPADTVGRMGGDEFVVVVGPPVSSADLEHLRQRLRVNLSAPLRERGTQTRVGVSIGLAMSLPDGSDDADSLLARADAAMYAVKRQRHDKGLVTVVEHCHEPGVQVSARVNPVPET